MRGTNWCARLGLIYGLLMTAPAEGAIIQFQGQSEVARSVVCLGDVAQILDADPEVIERLERLTLVPAPAPGRKMRLDFASVRSRLVAQGINLRELEFSGKSVLWVTRVDGEPASKKPAADRASLVSDWQVKRAQTLVGDAVREYLAQWVPELGTIDVDVQLQAKDVSLVLSGAPTGYEVQGGEPPWEQPQRFTIRFFDRQEVVQEISAVCRVRKLPEVLVVKHTVPKDHVLQRGDLDWKAVESSGAGIINPEEVIGMEAVRTIRQGEPIRKDDLRRVPLVRTNDIVTVYARKPGIAVRRQMKARSDGSIGDAVTLVTLDGREQVQGRVTGYHEAEVIGSYDSSVPQRQQSNRGVQFVTEDQQPSTSNGSRSPRPPSREIATPSIPRRARR